MHVPSLRPRVPSAASRDLQRRLRLLRRVALASAALLAIMAPGAHAATATLQNGTLTVIGTGGADSLSVSRGLDGTWSAADLGVGMAASTGCTNPPDYAGLGSYIAYCSGAVTSVVIQSGDGSDVVKVEDVPADVAVTVSLGSGTNSYDGHRAGRDVVTAGAGNDRIYTFGGHDSISSGGGRDEVRSGAGNDYVSAGDGNDWVYGEGGADTLLGGGGADTIYGREGNDTLRGGPGADTLDGGANRDTIYGDGGNDRLIDDSKGSTGFVPDRLFGGPGVDIADYSYRLSTATGAAPLRLSLDGRANDGRSGEGDNIGPDGSVEGIIGGGAADVIIGNGGANRLIGFYGNDVIYGNGGNDALYGREGSDTLYGGPGADYLDGESGNDIVYGNRGDDVVRGGYGSDRVYPGPGRDKANGGAGNDVIYARNSSFDVVECSFGWDVAQVDRGDRVSSLCERVYR